MSFIGNNIRKIRGVKKLSQSDFADLFNLKRGAIGAYEEGRAEPKIETVVEIANYFSISLDDLITKELSVNDLYRFDIFRNDLNDQAMHNLIPKSAPVDIVPVPLVGLGDVEAYLSDNNIVSGLPFISIPLMKGRKYRAFEIVDNAMHYNGLGPEAGDLVIGVQPDKFEIANIETDKVYLFETSREVLMRRVVAKSLSQLTLKGSSLNVYQKVLNFKDVQGIWQVDRIITKNIGSENSLRTKVRDIENELGLLKARMSLNH